MSAVVDLPAVVLNIPLCSSVLERAGLRAVRRRGLLRTSEPEMAARLEIRTCAIGIVVTSGKSFVQQVRETTGHVLAVCWLVEGGIPHEHNQYQNQLVERCAYIMYVKM